MRTRRSAGSGRGVGGRRGERGVALCEREFVEVVHVERLAGSRV